MRSSTTTLPTSLWTPAWLRLLLCVLAVIGVLLAPTSAPAPVLLPAEPKWGSVPSASLAGKPGDPAPGAPEGSRTLVLYNSSAPGPVTPSAASGEGYGTQAANLVSHSSAFELRQAEKYQPGDMTGFSAVVYVGLIDGGPLPDAFLADVRAGGTPVLWLGYDINRLFDGDSGYAAKTGWQPDGWAERAITGVDYKGVRLTRDAQAGTSVRTRLLDPAKARVLAESVHDDGSRTPWAVRSGTLTYVVEIPFAYVGPTDRYLAAADLIRATLSPSTPPRPARALVRLEDVGPSANPEQLKQIADRLHDRGVPFSVAVYPYYRDPKGIANSGVPTERRLADRPEMVRALRYMIDRGGTIVLHGYTHQFGDEPNPYGVSAADYEFYRARLNDEKVVELLGPVPGDSVQWASERFARALGELALVGLPDPAAFEFPHYTASAAGYQAATATFGVRYDRGSYFPGWCSTECGDIVRADPAGIFTQAFPYVVRDVYGAVVVPENLGYIPPWSEPAELDRHIEGVLSGARTLRVVDDGIASFFYHPYLGTEALDRIIDGITAAGYRFVSVSEAGQG
ncbi:hypothetical protein JOF56_003835 [Kibdelosporangium banguiense]|uniref:DUF2334 domain-containing protein n=1 Tax=Kibdelosporangium banguiense TaxID=1365924 RepID=A0ABS4THF2_9PSEU|nr:polysaccharide deacetylase family protein [Kibdelosporangium banguiense]MBP2323450.1 hypothetical protein [Kibdelosporangium banguiense]